MTAFSRLAAASVRSGWRGGASALALLSAGVVHAQAAPPPLPPGATGTTREEVNRADLQPQAAPPSRLTVEGGIERAPCALADARFADVKVTLSDVVFDNLKGVSPADLRPAYADLIGKTLPISAVCEIRDAAATILRREGYLAAVQVPPQSIENGVVHFDVLMAKLVAVQVRGQTGRSEELIAAYLNKLVGQDVFNEQEAERYLLLAKDLPGYDVRLTLRPANDGVPGDVIGQVSVVHIPGAIDANIQNLGSHAVGRWGALLRGELYGLIGAGDRLSLGAYSTLDTKEQQVAQASYDVHIGGEGFALGSRFTYAWTHPDVGAGANVRSHTLLASLEASYPFVRTQTSSTIGALGIDFVDQNTRFNGIPLTRDHLRVLYGRVGFDTVDPMSLRGEAGYSAAEPRWRFAGQLELRQPLGILDATRSCSAGSARCADPSFVGSSVPAASQRTTVVRLSGEADWRPVPNISFALSPQAQYAHAPVLNYERFSGGNYTVGRGYDPGAVIGDSGVGFTAEFRYGSLLPKSQNAIAWQPFAFVDAIWVWNKDPTQNIDNPERLVSVGGGMRAEWGNHARLDATLAVPLERAGPLDRRGDVRFLLSLTTRLLPWGR
jgi:hemolysin activation/secretion protein